MADLIRIDKFVVKRPASIGDRHPVLANADGSFEVREPTPIPFSLVKTAITANTANQGVNHFYSTSSVTGLLLPWDARLVGISVACQNAITVGTLTVKPQRGGASVVGASFSLGAGEQRKTQKWGYTAGFPYLATETFGLLVDTDAAFAPAAQNVIFSMFFAMQP